MSVGKSTDFTLLSSLPAASARFNFTGSYLDPDRFWRAELMTLEHYRKIEPVEARGTPGQFIDISDSPDNETNIIIVLDVPVIDEPVIRKTIIMIRQYRDLRPGKHEWKKHSR